MKIPGLTFSLKRAIGLTQVKQKIARTTGIPTSRQGIERKIGKFIIDGLINREKSANRFNKVSK